MKKLHWETTSPEIRQIMAGFSRSEIGPAFHLVHDVDDTRQAPYGVYYTQKKPLILAALENDSPGI